MTLQQQLSDDLKQAIMGIYEDKKTILRIIVGELQRQKEKELSDDKVVSILRKLVKSERELLDRKGLKNSAFIKYAEKYIPGQVDSDEITKWIQKNIDLSIPPDQRIRFMSDIMKHFGTRTTGNVVKNILLNL